MAYRIQLQHDGVARVTFDEPVTFDDAFAAFHALTSDRPYRKGMPLGKALDIIDGARGTQLCPDCVGLFQKYLFQEDAGL